MNKVFLIGNLTKDPDLRYTPQGVAVTTLRIAVNSGLERKVTLFINIICWNKLAELCNQYLEKGRKILVEGKLQQRTWQDQEGRKREVFEIRADRIEFLDKAPQKEEIDLGPLPEELEGKGPQEVGGQDYE